SGNVAKTTQTTKRDTRNLTRSSPLWLKRELQLISVECNFTNIFAPLWRLLPVYFPLSQPLLAVIISKINFVSSHNLCPAPCAGTGWFIICHATDDGGLSMGIVDFISCFAKLHPKPEAR